MEDKKQNTDKRLILEVVGLILLACCLVVTSAALTYRAVSVEDNLFRTGTVAINLNDGKPVIAAHEGLFEPGMTVEKTFFIQNRSTWDVYYRLYLSEVAGGLALMCLKLCWKKLAEHCLPTHRLDCWHLRAVTLLIKVL